MDLPGRLRFGMYDVPWLVGVAVLGVPMQRRVLTVGLPGPGADAKSLELSRFVLAESLRVRRAPPAAADG